MPNTFYVSDTHFGHKNIIRLDGRPFATIEENDSALIDSWNNVVRPADTVIICGDFCWGKEKEWIEILDRLKGNKVLVRGNHDPKNPSAELKRRFADIMDYLEIKENGVTTICSHYPIMFYKHDTLPNVWHIHGHTHETHQQRFVDDFVCNRRKGYTGYLDTLAHIINVGVMRDYMGYAPKTLDQIITSYYTRYPIMEVEK